MNSALYRGTLRHRRFSPRPHRLAYPLFMAFVDLDELDAAFAGSRLWSARRPAVAWLRRRDYFGPYDRPWPEAVRDAVERRCGHRPSGAVRLLTNPRTLGLRMNPVSFYYCFDEFDELEAVLAEVTNTPWDERHLYVVHRDVATRSDRYRSAHRRPSWTTWLDKDFHVSPFLPMSMRYRWAFTPPGERLLFHMENHRDGERIFDATLSLRREEMTPRSLRRVLLRHPAMTARILTWIYVHAALLGLKGVRFHPHPKPRLTEDTP